MERYSKTCNTRIAKSNWWKHQVLYRTGMHRKS